MKIHILGICGTFMGGVAVLARAAGHEVSGSDANVYPPMSTQLENLGIDIHEGYDEQQLDAVPDCVVVGNAMSRGNACVEAMLNRNLRYQSGPQWLAENVLQDRWVLAVSGTHGKTTTASMLAWILEDAGLNPGFLIGGIPANFGISARFGESRYFVVEADEYDTAFFDKRAKFVHYRPRTLIINNIEYDHADIYRDLDAIYWQFHQLLRTVPGDGLIIARQADPGIDKVLAMGCWSKRQGFAAQANADWRGEFVDAEQTAIRVINPSQQSASSSWQLNGAHNLENAVAAIAAACDVGVPFDQAVASLAGFKGVKRRLEQTATVGTISVYDDFAHHPTAIRRTIEGIKRRDPERRLVIALEPRSNTMKMGVHNRTLAASLEDADFVHVFLPGGADDPLGEQLRALGKAVALHDSYEELVAAIVDGARAGDNLVFMSNGGFGACRETVTGRLQKAAS